MIFSVCKTVGRPQDRRFGAASASFDWFLLASAGPDLPQSAIDLIGYLMKKKRRASHTIARIVRHNTIMASQPATSIYFPVALLPLLFLLLLPSSPAVKRERRVL